MYLRRPPHPPQLLRTHQLPRRSVRFAQVMLDVTFEANNLADEFGEFEDGDVFAAADIDVGFLGVGFHQEDEGVGAVVCVQEFAAGGAGAPDDDFLVAAYLCLMRLADQGWQDVA